MFAAPGRRAADVAPRVRPCRVAFSLAVRSPRLLSQRNGTSQVFKEAKLAAINKVEVQALPSRLRGLLSARSRALTYRCWRSDDGVTVTMVSGRNDAELQALGRSHGMPRGFFVLQRDGAADPDSATYGGFYPKFANDHKDEAVSGQRLEEFAEIRVSPKFSGHLGEAFAMALRYNRTVNEPEHDASSQRLSGVLGSSNR